MPSGISRAKNSKKLENQVPKPTLAVSGKTPGRVGFWKHLCCDTPFREADTDRVSSLFSISQPPLLTRPVLANTAGRVRAIVSPFFFICRARNACFACLSLRCTCSCLKPKKLPQKDTKWSMMMHITCTQQIETTILSI